MKRILYLSILLTLAFGLVACGGGDDSDADAPDAAESGSGDAAAGEALYKQTVIGSASAPGCSTCHSLDADVQIVGPSHATIGADADGRIAGKSAEEYLRDSITDPDADLSDGFTAGIMYQNYGSELSNTEVNDLVAFLLTQK